MYKVRFRGTSTEEIIEAANIVSAKWIFAMRHGVNSLTYITASKIK